MLITRVLILLLLSITVRVRCFKEKTDRNIKLNSKPLIGVPAMTITDKVLLRKKPELKGKSYIAASYVKYIEMAGARVLSIPPDLSDKEERELFESVNGLLFSGGEVNLETSDYYKLTSKLFRWAVEANLKDDFFPVFGICRGMQALAVHTVGNLSPLSLTDARNYTASLKWSDGYEKSDLLSGAADGLLEQVGRENITSHFHKYGITPKTYNELDEINKIFQIVATSTDRNGKEFISILEGRNIPFYGVQFHPEKTIFEWSDILNIPHSLETIKFSQLLADNFVQLARTNKHRPTNDKLTNEHLVSMQVPVYIEDLDSHSPFTQIFVYP